MGYFDNSREIIRGYKDKFRSTPSESLAQKIEHLTGDDIDYRNADEGEVSRGVRKLEVTVEYDPEYDFNLGEILTKYYG